MNYTEQLQRIKRKLRSVRICDPLGMRFGAKNHRYVLRKPLSDDKVRQLEKNAGICLPEDFRAFVTTLGNRGPWLKFSPTSDISPTIYYGAGPYYGIKPLKLMFSNLSEEYKWVYQSPCTLFPNMSEEQWVAIYNEFNKQRLALFPEDGQEEPVEPLPGEHNFPGMIVIGTQGCTYDIMLVLNGPYRGKVAYIDEGLDGIPFFTHEQNFLDWYERWLDEILAGYDITWFGFGFGGDEQTLIQLFQKTEDETVQERCIVGFRKFRKINETSLSFLETVAKMNSSPVKCRAIEMLAEFDYPRSKPYLTQAIRGNELEMKTAIFEISRRDKKHYDDWAEQILAVVPNITDAMTLHHASDILKDGKAFYDVLLKIPNPPEFVRKKLIDKLGFYPALGYPADTIVHPTFEMSDSPHTPFVCIANGDLEKRKCICNKQDSLWTKLLRRLHLK